MTEVDEFTKQRILFGQGKSKFAAEHMIQEYIKSKGVAKDRALPEGRRA